MSSNPLNTSCQRFAPLLDAYFDGELAEPSLLAGFSSHLDACASCRADLEAMQLLREGVRSIPRPAAMPGLRESVRSRLLPFHDRRPRQERMMRAINRPIPALAVAALSILLVGTVGRLYSNYRSTSNLWPRVQTAIPLVEDHISLVQRDGGSSMPSKDPSALEAWFGEQMIFPPPVPTWPWANLEGGRICFINGHRVARIQYTADGRTFSLFVQYIGKDKPQNAPSHCDSGGTASIAEMQGYKAAYWDKDGFSYVLVAHESADPVFYHLQHER